MKIYCESFLWDVFLYSISNLHYLGILFEGFKRAKETNKQISRQ